MITRALLAEIEAIVDRDGLNLTLDALCEVCFAKAEHTSANGDKALAKLWSKAGNRLARYCDCGDI